jgi:hypothetical protein
LARFHQLTNFLTLTIAGGLEVFAFTNKRPASFIQCDEAIECGKWEVSLSEFGTHSFEIRAQKIHVMHWFAPHSTEVIT